MFSQEHEVREGRGGAKFKLFEMYPQVQMYLISYIRYMKMMRERERERETQARRRADAGSRVHGIHETEMKPVYA